MIAIRKAVAFILVAMCASHCFEFREIIAFHKDGSGKFVFRMGIQEKYRAIFNMAGAKKAEESQDLKKSAPLSIAPESIQNIPGISNIQFQEKKEELSGEISFDFANIEALNTAYNQLFNKNNAGQSVFRFTGNEFERLQVNISQMSQAGAPPAIPGLEVLYITEYSFPYKIRKNSNARAITGLDGRSVSLTASLLKPGENTIDNQVQFRRWYHCFW